MNRSPAVAVFNALLVGGVLAAVLAGGTAHASSAAPTTTLKVPAVVQTGGTITFSGAGCRSTPQSPAAINLTVGDYLAIISVAEDGSWSHTVSVGKNLSGVVRGPSGVPFELFDGPPGTYAVQAVCDQYTGSSTLTTSFTVEDPSPPTITLDPTCIRWYGCKSSLQNLSASDYANQHGGIDVTISGFATSASLNPKVIVTSPDSSVWELADASAVLAAQGLGEPLFFSYYDGDENPQLGVYTVTVKDDYESASATFTVVPNVRTSTVDGVAPNKNSNDLAATGVKLDVPVALSTSGLLLVAGAAALTLSRRRTGEDI